MPGLTPHQLREPRLTTLDVYRLLDTYVRAGEEVVARPWRLAADTARRAGRRVEQGLLGQWGAKQVAAHLARDYVDLMCGLVATVPVVVADMASRLADPSHPLLSEYRVPISGAHPEAVGTLIELGTQPKTPFILPARVVDASQGWAAWFVTAEQVLDLMRAAAKDGWIEAAVLEHFVPIDCGDGRSAVVLLGAEHRVGDLGRYREVALALYLTPRGRAPQPGLFFAWRVVSDPFPIEPGKRIWGFRQQHFCDVDASYGDASVRFHTGAGTKDDFAMTLPRFGHRRSSRIPLVLYSIHKPEVPGATAGPVRVVMQHSGNGEGMQIGGSVELHRGRKAAASGGKRQSGSCFCSQPGIACLCDTIDRLGIDKRLPAANGWTERVTGDLQAPEPMAFQSFGNQ